MMYGYARVSTLDQVDNSSLVNQQNVIAGLAQMKSQVIEKTFCDPAVSGKSEFLLRPAGKELLQIVRSGDAIVVSRLDRGFRNVQDALATARHLESLKVDLYVADLGVDPVGKGITGKFIFTILAAVAEMEREVIRERVTNGKRSKRAAGGHAGGKTPFGYRVEGVGKEATLIPVQHEQQAIRLAFQWRSEGMAYRNISERLATEYGVTLSHVGVSRLLARGVHN